MSAIAAACGIGLEGRELALLCQLARHFFSGDVSEYGVYSLHHIAETHWLGIPDAISKERHEDEEEGWNTDK